MVCFYHDDMDGRCAASLVYDMVVPHDEYGPQPNFAAVNYNRPFPVDMVRDGEQVWLVDYSIPPDQMRGLLKRTLDVTWIDHHKTAIEDYRDFEQPIAGLRYDGIAACALTHAYLAHMTGPEDPGVWTEGSLPFRPEMADVAPPYVLLIADRDVWTYRFGDDTRNFHLALGMYDTAPEARVWEDLRRAGWDISEWLQEGATLARYFECQNAKQAAELAYGCEFEGHAALAVNIPRISSDFFASRPGYEVYVAYFWDGEKWVVSLYSDGRVDVGALAKKFGGGGHKGAAGFQLPRPDSLFAILLRCAPLPEEMRPKSVSTEDVA